MKKIYTILLLIFSLSLVANEVIVSKAIKVGENFLFSELGFSNPSLSLVDTKRITLEDNSQEIAFYVFNSNNQNGFVIVSAQDIAHPVLAYSTSSDYIPSTLPPQLLYFLDNYVVGIKDLLENNVGQDKDINTKWNQLENGEPLNSFRSGGTVTPLITTNWGQGGYYNDLCPDGSLTGCVATAMAQVMKFWNHPESGNGSYSYIEDDFGTLSADFSSTNYDWASMPNNVNSSNNAVATLMYHCGVAVSADYGSSGTGAYCLANSAYPNGSMLGTSIEEALPDFFDYDNDIAGVDKSSYSSSEWIDLIKNELNEGRPVVYRGDDDANEDSGHAFVCDGYDELDYFHFNWGWDGSYQNTYFYIDDLTPGWSSSFNDNQGAVIGIQPAQAPVYDGCVAIIAGCQQSASQIEMDINNVRTTIQAGGDMWWDLDNGKYEIPKGSGKHSIFAGSLWIGGMDDQGNIKVAAQTYRQDGNDFWPGPLDGNIDSNNYGGTTFEDCQEYDEHFMITRQEVEDFVAYNECVASPNCDVATEYPNYTMSDAIANWPASRLGFDGTTSSLAPYEDVNGDGLYTVGIDYPRYDLNGEANCNNEDYLYGDQTVWWVFNDNGNEHNETGSESSIGLEIQAQGFAMSTANPIDNMTFYTYKIINRSACTLNDTYFGQWVDPDLGYYLDDYVGCDVELGLGYCYNGDEIDESSAGYNYDSDAPPPAIGIDFFRGPLADMADGIDNDRDGVIDEMGEQIIMSKFVYYNNDASDYGNPEAPEHYYNYLRGIWKNGQPMTYGGTGWEAGNPECDFMFPNDTDPNFSTPWTESTAGNTPADRRFLQSAGPFTLEPGAVNYITTGVVWARAEEGTALSSVELLKQHDQLAQNLFDICFDEEALDPELFGCIDPIALNFDPDASYSDGSCIYEGCTDSEACNYESWASVEDGSCEYCFYYSTNYPLIGVFDSNANPNLVSVSTTSFGPEGVCISPGDTAFILPENSFLIDDLESMFLETGYEPVENWLYPIPDGGFYEEYLWEDYPYLRPTDWVRSGTKQFSEANEVIAPYHYFGDISQNGTPIDPSSSSILLSTPCDPNEHYEFQSNPWLVPYKLLSADYKGRKGASTGGNIVNSIDTIGGGIAYKNWKNYSLDLSELQNVDIILTSDQAMWTRCPIIDMSEDRLEWLANGDPIIQSDGPTWPFNTSSGANYPWEIYDQTGENGESKWDLRLDSNVGKDGNPDGTGNGFNSENGWGWFPGYAINISTGQRLNLMFSENSSLGSEYNGNDMLFNPTPYLYGSSNDASLSNDIPTMNGGHALFILEEEYQGDNIEDNPYYNRFTGSNSNTAWNSLRKRYVIQDIMWVGYWLSSESQPWLNNEVTIQARVNGFDATQAMNINCELECIDDQDGDGVCDENDNISIDETLISLDRNLLQVVDILGRNIDRKSFNGALLYIYDDGSIEKKYMID